MSSWKREPALPREEVDEHQAVEERLDEELLALRFLLLLIFRIATLETLHEAQCVVEYPFVLLEERSW